MTIIEFFDRDFIENIASALLCNPDKVIFVGDDEKAMLACESRFKEITVSRGLKVDFDHKLVERNSLSSIVQALAKIADESPDCHFDIEGGEDLYLVAVGIVSEMFKGNISLHRYNIVEDKLNDFDMDGRPHRIFKGQINVNENIKIYGGRVIYEDEDPRDGTKNTAFTAQLCSDVHDLWSVCRNNVGDWNFLMTDISNNAQRSCLNYTYHKAVTTKDETVLRLMSQNGLIKNLRITPDEVTFTCKNQLVEECILKVGTLLELVIATTCADIKDQNGDRYYGDVKTGVFIDWDGVQAPGSDVENEIDVLATRGMIPVFISCKSGAVYSDELYKLSTVAERFGGKYAVKILCTTDLNRNTSSPSTIRARAEDMGIRIVDKIHLMDDFELKKSLMI